MYSNKIIVITAPSGAGKTSITKYLLAKNNNLSFSISAATRSPRANEINGKDYYFMAVDEFQQKIKNNEFVEWEMVYEGKYYGTLVSELNRLWQNNKVPVLDIDVKGAIHVQQKFRENVCSIFIMPPAIDDLKRRLIERGTENEQTLKDRLSKASYEISFKEMFDHIVINDDLQKAQIETEKIVNHFLSI